MEVFDLLIRFEGYFHEENETRGSLIEVVVGDNNGFLDEWIKEGGILEELSANVR